MFRYFKNLLKSLFRKNKKHNRETNDFYAREISKIQPEGKKAADHLFVHYDSINSGLNEFLGESFYKDSNWTWTVFATEPAKPELTVIKNEHVVKSNNSTKPNLRIVK